MEISEELFIKFCKSKNIQYRKLKEDQKKIPDFLIKINRQLYIVEVKQIDPNKLDKNMPSHAIFLNDSGRIRSKIYDAKKQIKRCIRHKLPSIIVLYDNTPFGVLDNEEILKAMYGEEQLIVTHNLNNPSEYYINDYKYGQRQTFTRNHTKYISSVARLNKNQTFDIFLNRYTENRLILRNFKRVGRFAFILRAKSDYGEVKVIKLR